MDNVECRKTEAETIAKNWWDFSKSKLRMMRWLEKKENDLEIEAKGGGGLENAVQSEKKLKVNLCFIVVLRLSLYTIIISL